MFCNVFFSFFILISFLYTSNITISMNRSHSYDSLNNQISIVSSSNRRNQETPESRRITFLENELQTNNIAVQQLSQQVNCLTEVLTKLASQNTNDSSSLVRKPHFESLQYNSVEKDLDDFKRKELQRTCPEEISARISMLLDKEEVPYHETWLLHGPQGSGKSSLGKLIAYLLKRPYKFVRASNLSDELKSAPQTFINALFDPLIENKNPSVVILDELTAFTDKLQNHNDGDTGAVQHFWTALDACKANPNLLVIATLNDLDRVPRILRDRCIEYFIGHPDIESRTKILKNYLLTSQVSEKLLESLASKSEEFSLRNLEEVINKTKINKYKRNKKLKEITSTDTIINEEDIKEAFNAVYEKQKAISRKERYKYLKAGLIEWSPVIFPLIRMVCDYGIQHLYHCQQASINQEHYQENQDMQKRHHHENQRIQEQWHQEEIARQNTRHNEGMNIAQNHNKDALIQQTATASGGVLGAGTSAILIAASFDPITAAIAGTAVALTTTTSPTWCSWAKSYTPSCIKNSPSYVKNSTSYAISKTWALCGYLCGKKK